MFVYLIKNIYYIIDIISLYSFAFLSMNKIFLKI